MKRGAREQDGDRATPGAQGFRTQQGNCLVKLNSTQTATVNKTTPHSHPLVCSTLSCLQQRSAILEEKKYCSEQAGRDLLQGQLRSCLGPEGKEVECG